jgi:hypothetical protein
MPYPCGPGVVSESCPDRQLPCDNRRASLRDSRTRLSDHRKCVATDRRRGSSVRGRGGTSRVDAQALSAACFHELANTVSFALDRCADQGHPLTERQRATDLS